MTGWAAPRGGDAVAVATLAVNTVGCMLIGVLTVLAIDRWPDARLLRPALGTGVLGGFTTFSAYAVDVEALARQGRPGAAAAYLVATPTLAMVAVWAGARLTRRLVEAATDDRSAP